VRVDSGYQVWSETFDRPLTDVFKVQDEIAGAVVQVLKLSILDHYRPEPIPTANIEAYTLYLRALSHLTKNGVADFDAAAEHLRSALVLDPNFAAAWSLLATSTVNKFDGRSTPVPAACASARAAADQALKLNSTLAVAHRAKGIVLQTCDSNLPAAEVEFTTALELEPGSSDMLRAYAWFALEANRLDQALQLAQRAAAADPLNEWNFAAIGDVLFQARRLDEAEVAYRKAVEIDPMVAGLHGMLANILLTDHKPVEAVAEAEGEPDAEWREETLPFALDAAGRKSDADRAIATYELKYADDGPGVIAEFYACRHDVDRAVKWFSAWAARHTGVYSDFPYRVDCLKNVESDPRFKTLRQRVKLP
jgi:tetratricopeptide (TPR) repeat protein